MLLPCGFFKYFPCFTTCWSLVNQEPEPDQVPLYDKQLAQLTPGQKIQLIGRVGKIEPRPRHSRSLRHNIENVQAMVEKKVEGTLGRRSRKRRSNEKMGATVVSIND